MATVPDEIGPLTAQRRIRLSLRRFREQASITQEHVASVMEWSVAKVIRMEAGIKKVCLAPNRPIEFVLDEAVLHRAVGGPLTLRDQLSRILELTEQLPISLHVLPYTAGGLGGLIGPHTIFDLPSPDPGAVMLENPGHDVLLDSLDDSMAQQFRLQFRSLKAAALSRDASIRVLQDITSHRPVVGGRIGSHAL